MKLVRKSRAPFLRNIEILDIKMALGSSIEWTEATWNPVTGCSKISTGVTVEDQKCVFRIDHLRKTSAKIKFLSMEPLLGPISDLDLAGIYWVIVGGESGPRARPLNSDWVMDIKAKCQEAEVPFFFK